MIRQNAAMWAGILVLIFGAIFFSQSLQFDYYGENGPGPAFLPRWLSGFIILLGLLYVAESVRHKILFKDILPKAKGLKNIFIILGSLILFLIILNIVGFIAASTVFLFILLVREYRWYVALVIAVGISALLFWIFGSLLSVPLPVNIYGW